MTTRIKVIFVLMLLTFGLISAPAIAQDKPFQLALFNPVQIVPEGEAISGIRLSLLYGKNTTVSGLDWGLVNHTTKGVSKGVQFGLVGYAEADFVGWQDCWVNVTKGNFEGMQWGVVNHANYVHGLQLGLVNHAVTMKGLQIGLINIIDQGGQFPFFPIVNWSF
ncbi:MAG: hypothetical protein V3W18_03315 [candidate division Zixibacteria bacterium]